MFISAFLFGLWFELVVKVRRFDVSRLYFEGSYLQHLNIMSLSTTSMFFLSNKRGKC